LGERFAECGVGAGLDRLAVADEQGLGSKPREMLEREQQRHVESLRDQHTIAVVAIERPGGRRTPCRSI
jgi:hypothetical protein